MFCDNCDDTILKEQIHYAITRCNKEWKTVYVLCKNCFDDLHAGNIVLGNIQEHK